MADRKYSSALAKHHMLLTQLFGGSFSNWSYTYKMRRIKDGMEKSRVILKYTGVKHTVTGNIRRRGR